MGTDDSFHAGLLVFPGMTQLDLTGPYEVLHRMPDARVHLIARTLEPARSEHGLPISPTVTFGTCPSLDLLLIPGGFGVNELLVDEATLAFVREAAASARYVGSVCTGSLVLGAAGLLTGKRATCHWMSLDFLRDFGAIPVSERVVADGRVITGGGVTAGIDLALTVVAEVAGRAAAEEIQLAIEYDPRPPFSAGSPESAGRALVETLRSKWAQSQTERRERVRKAATALGSQ